VVQYYTKYAPLDSSAAMNDVRSHPRGSILRKIGDDKDDRKKHDDGCDKIGQHPELGLFQNGLNSL
jgi:hypothetical protein